MPWIQAATQPPGMQPRPRTPHPWYEFKNVADDEAEVLVYDEIGSYWGTCAEDFVRELRNVTARKVTVRVNSPGGSFFDGVTCANALRAHPSTVTVRVEGLCASAASVIAMAGDRIEMAPQTQLMIHDAIGGAYGNAQVMREMVDVLDRISDSIADAYAARAGGTREEWRERTRAETWYSPEEALAAGLIDEALPLPRRGEEPAEPAPPAEPEMRNSWDLSVFRYAGREQAPAPQPIAARITAAIGEGAVCTMPTAGSVLTADVASLVGEQIVNALRAAVTPEPAPAVPAVADTAVAPHDTAVEDGEWDASANEKRLPSPVPVATVKKMYAVYDETTLEDGAVPKTAAKLPHHFVNEDGTPGAASVAAVRNALARLPQTEGLSDAERGAAERHLQAHLDAYHDTDNQATAAPQAQQQIVVQVHLDGRAAGEAFLDATRKAVATKSPPEPAAPATTGLAARAAHLTKPARPAAPTWRDRVAHLNPPSSATTQPAP